LLVKKIGTLGGSAVKKFVRWIYHLVIATATFTAADQGQQGANSNLLYKGIVFYRAEPTGKLGFLDNKIGLYVAGKTRAEMIGPTSGSGSKCP
jgi:hypothetical protein